MNGPASKYDVLIAMYVILLWTAPERWMGWLAFAALVLVYIDRWRTNRRL